MQINCGTNNDEMAASEPPEPPPRNPDKINSSLKVSPQSNKSNDETKLEPTDKYSPSNKDDQINFHDNNSTERKENGATAKNPNYMNLNCTSLNDSLNNSMGLSDDVINNSELETPTNGTQLNTIQENEPDVQRSQDLKLENEALKKEVARLKRLIENSVGGAIGGLESCAEIERLETELKSTKELNQKLKLERRKLKSDKNDLLRHVRQLCTTLQDKEQELRDFIRNYEQRLRENDTNNAKMSAMQGRERWSLIKQAQDESERSIALAEELNARDIQLRRTQEQLQEARRQLSGCLSDQESVVSFALLTPPSGLKSDLNAPGGVCNYDTTIRGTSDKDSTAGDLNLSDGVCESGPFISIDPDNVSLVSSNQYSYQYGTPKDRSPTFSPLNSTTFSRSIDSGSLSRSVEQLRAPVEGEELSITKKIQSKLMKNTLGRNSSRGGTWGSISRVFARSKKRQNILQYDNPTNDSQWNNYNEDTFAEKLKLLREAAATTIDQWKAPQVLAWLEIALGMPQYSAQCAENIKSGKLLLELSDTELENCLGLSHPIHKKKLRLAIEEHRRPDLIRYPLIGQLGHMWVISEWLPDLGLPQYTESFLHCLVDARMLDTLSKKELEKYLGVTKKFHQASIVHGIHVLRIMKYDRQSLLIRRSQSEHVDTDPIVWTNQRFIRWAYSIDLGEYANNLKETGVHGGLVVLEPSFSAETMASALGIPASKNIIRRHLAAEFEALIAPARASLGQGIRTGSGSIIPITGSNGLQQPYNTDRRLRFSSWKGSQGSISKAFQFIGSSRSDKQNPTSPTSSYGESESSMYAIIGNQQSQTTSPVMPNHRVSAPPLENCSSTLPRYVDHRRVKSISDIEIIAATP